MPQYVVRLAHTSDQCPFANTKIRERAAKTGPELAKLAEKLAIKFLTEPMLLMTEHISIVVVEAERIETVEELILRSGLMQWNTVQVSTAKPLNEAMKELEKSPPAIY